MFFFDELLIILGGWVIARKGFRFVRSRLVLKPSVQTVSLEGLSTTVFVRESNGSRTNLEHYLENELITRGARVVMANQQAGMTLVKQGDFTPLNSSVHFTVVGTLIISTDISVKKHQYTESYHEYASRKAQWELDHSAWEQNEGRYSSFSGELWSHKKENARPRYPEPVLEERGWQWIDVPITLFQFSFRLVGKDGALLASGICESSTENIETTEGILHDLAAKAIAHLDQNNVWSKIVID